ASGFGWDEINCKFLSLDDVWQTFVASHPHAQSFQGMPFPEFQKLDVIFGFSGTTGTKGNLQFCIFSAAPAINKHIF
ncbi:uncharacterized protein VP01_887g10, partial [Puccinia sorghi]